jgi:16S rRNA (adenine(1408)-N(1))-methyltransferase
VAAPFDNSQETNSKESLLHTGEGVVMDIGTGDGRFVSAAARANPNKFYIGIDANVKPLEKISMRATRKIKKGGLPNAMFVQAAVEDLPKELNGRADEIHVHFPWGSLLKAVATGDEAVLRSFHRIAAPGCLLEIFIAVDPRRDQAELVRLGIPQLSNEYLANHLIPRYKTVGFEAVENGVMNSAEWSRLETSWARRLQGNTDRRVVYMIFRSPI